MSGILATGSCLPARVLTNAELEKMVDTTDAWITSRTGIKERHIVVEETSLDLSYEAATRALESANVSPEQLGLIICATLTADNATPALACTLMAKLGASCPAFDINAACSGFVFALNLAHKLAGDKYALVVGCELLSRIVDWTDRSTCVLFGDGAGAAVLGPGGAEILYLNMMSYPDTNYALYIPGINRTKQGEVVRSTLLMDGPEVYRFATRVLYQDIINALEALNLTPNDVTWFVPHQANLRIIKTTTQLLGVPAERFYVNIHKTGNTSSASVPIAFDELVRGGKVKKGDIVLLSAFGGGLTSATAVLRW